MEPVKSITEQELDDSRMRHKLCTRELVRTRAIVWGYRNHRFSMLVKDFDTYMLKLPRERFELHFSDKMGDNFWREFVGEYSIYEETEPDMTWSDFLTKRLQTS
jgi:hypothetical protein